MSPGVVARGRVPAAARHRPFRPASRGPPVHLDDRGRRRPSWPRRREGESVTVLAHRGGRGPWRENTLEAFRGALAAYEVVDYRYGCAEVLADQGWAGLVMMLLGDTVLLIAMAILVVKALDRLDAKEFARAAALEERRAGLSAPQTSR